MFRTCPTSRSTVLPCSSLTSIVTGATIGPLDGVLHPLSKATTARIPAPAIRPEYLLMGSASQHESYEVDRAVAFRPASNPPTPGMSDHSQTRAAPPETSTDTMIAEM